MLWWLIQINLSIYQNLKSIRFSTGVLTAWKKTRSIRGARCYWCMFQNPSRLNLLRIHIVVVREKTEKNRNTWENFKEEACRYIEICNEQGMGLEKVEKIDFSAAKLQFQLVLNLNSTFRSTLERPRLAMWVAHWQMLPSIMQSLSRFRAIHR